MSDEEAPKRNIFKKLGSSLENILFTHEQVEETPVAEDEQTTESVETVTVQPSRVKKDDAVVKTILQSASESGSALTNFESYLKTFEGIISDEGSRYKAAFAALTKNESLSVKNLLDAATAQMNALKNEKAEFIESINEKRAEVGQLNKEMAGIDKRIADLNRQIQELETAKSTKTELARKLEINIQKAGEKFDAALVTAEEILKSKKNKLQMYLKNM